MEKRCPKCNKMFECENSVSCWCADLTDLPQNKIESNCDCLCINCLKNKLEKKI